MNRRQLDQPLLARGNSIHDTTHRTVGNSLLGHFIVFDRKVTQISRLNEPITVGFDDSGKEHRRELRIS